MSMTWRVLTEGRREAGIILTAGRSIALSHCMAAALCML